MKARSMHSVAAAIAVVATILELWAPGQALQWAGLFGLAFIVSLWSIVEAVHRCANALEKDAGR